MSRGLGDVYKRQEETYSLDSPDIECKAFKFFVVEQVHILFADFIEIIYSLDFHRFGFNPFSVLNVTALCRNFSDIDFRVEVCRKRITMVTAVAVKNVNIVNFIKVMFLCIS